MECFQLAQPWRETVDARLYLIDYLESEIAAIGRTLRTSGAEHRYVPMLLTVPGIGWVLAFTIAAEIGDIIHRSPTARKLTGYTGLCTPSASPGEKDRRAPLTKQGPKYLRWAMLEATMHALRHPYRERYQRTKTPPRQTTRRQYRPDRQRPQAHRSHLTHAQHQPTLQPCNCCGRRH